MAAAAAPTKPPLSVEDLVDLQVPQNVAVASTGKRVAYVVKTLGQARDHDVSAIWMAKVDQPNSARQVTSGMYHDWSPVWAPDGSKRLAFLSDRSGKGRACSVYLMNQEHISEPMLLTPDHTENAITHITWSPDGQYIAFLSPTSPGCDRVYGDNDACEYGVNWELNRLHMLHVATRTVTIMYSGSSHVNDVAWRADSKALFCTLHCNSSFDSAVEKGVDFLSIDVQTRRQKDLGTFDGPLRSRIQFTENSLFFTAGQVPGLFNTSGVIYAFDVDRCELKAIGSADDSCMFDVKALPHARILHVQQNMFDELWTRRSEGTFKLLWGAPQEISSFDAIQLGDDGSTIIALILSSAGKPPEVYTFCMTDPTAKVDHQPIQLSDHGSNLRSKRLSKAEEIDCRSFDGQATIRAMLYVPEGYTKRAQGPLQTVCMIHGGPHMRVTDAFLPRAMGHPWVVWLASHGYAVLCPNYRGSAGQGDAFARAAHGKMGTVDYDDTLALMEEGMRRGVVDRDAVAVAGWSQGGFLAYLSAARNGYAEESGALGWRYRGAICGAGVTEWDMVNMTSISPRFGAELIGSEPWTRSRHDVRAREASAVWELRSTDAPVPPVLILHGERDTQIPLAQAVAFWRFARARGLDCRLVIYPREGHFARERTHVADMMRRVLQFCADHLSRDSKDNGLVDRAKNHA